MSSEEMPECCGSGCAVCVLDSLEPVSRVSTITEREEPAAQCCGTGCTVCVLDYLNDGSPTSDEVRLARMLEAVELAEDILSIKRQENQLNSCLETRLDNGPS